MLSYFQTPKFSGLSTETQDVFDVPGGITGGATPVPIPNTEVKPSKADDTAAVRQWESRTLPGYKKKPAGENQQAFLFLSPGPTLRRKSMILSGDIQCDNRVHIEAIFSTVIALWELVKSRFSSAVASHHRRDPRAESQHQGNLKEKGLLQVLQVLKGKQSSPHDKHSLPLAKFLPVVVSTVV